jgi:hypothetical protein
MVEHKYLSQKNRQNRELENLTSTQKIASIKPENGKKP